MKQSLLLIAAAAVSSFQVLAQEKTFILANDSVITVKPALTLKVAVGEEVSRTFSFGSYKDLDFYAVDFGDGNLVATDTIGNMMTRYTKTAVSGVAVGEGNIVVYASDPTSIYALTTSTGSTVSPIYAADVSALTRINTLSLGCFDGETIDLAGLDSLSNFTSFNGGLRRLDFSHNAELKSISVAQNKLTNINVASNAKLTSLVAYSNLLENIDLSANPLIETLSVNDNAIASLVMPATADALNTLNLTNNSLTELNLAMLTKNMNYFTVNNNKLQSLVIPVQVKTFEAENNEIAEFSVVDATYSCKLANNALTLATLPTKPAGLNSNAKIKRFTYAPQADLSVAESYEVGQSIDLSAQLSSTGILAEPATTTYTLVSANGEAVAAEAYSVTDGIVTLRQAQDEPVCVVMTTEAFPLFTAGKEFKTTAFTVAAATGIAALEQKSVSSTTRYNLQGAEVSRDAKGLVIEAGKKLLVK